MNHKVGEKLICHKRCKMIQTDIYCTSINKIYAITNINGIDNSFAIIDDEGHPHWFKEDNYSRWFGKLKDIRKNKILKINEL